MGSQSPFRDDWRECLVAQYNQVVKNADYATERTLRMVMLQAGFSEDEIKKLYIIASAHDENPDMDIFLEDF